MYSWQHTTIQIHGNMDKISNYLKGYRNYVLTGL